MKLILIVFSMVEILFILFNDIPCLINPSSNVIWDDSRFFILHLLLLFVSIIGLILVKILIKCDKNKFKNMHNLLISNSINGLIFFLAVILISTVIYNYHYEKIAKNIIFEEANFKLNYLSNHDPLTGLLNRRSFGTQVHEKMRIITETKGLAALILLDIDHFKHINDKFGHPIGDIVLKEISSIITEHIKTTDLATRWGGEEFLIFLFQTSLDEAYALADNIRLAIQNKVIQTDESQIYITASLGVSILKNNSSNSFDTSYKAADTALYKAKHQSRNQVVTSSLNTEE